MSNIHESEFAGSGQFPQSETHQISSDIFVPKDEEQDYLNAHGIEIRRLDNGVLLAGATRTVEDDARTSLNLHMPSGAYYEPVGKSGINHFIEHLVSNRPGKAARQNEVEYNAHTTSAAINMSLEGSAHPDVPDYGVWNVLPTFFSQCSNSFSVTDKEMESEKGVILGEIHEKIHDHNRQVDQFFRSVVYGGKNPINYRVIGSREDVCSLTTHDIREQHGKIFVPQGLEATIFSQGSRQITTRMLDKAEEFLGKIPNNGDSPAKVDKRLLAELNPDYAQAAKYVMDTGLENKQVTINYTWVLPAEIYTVDFIAMQEFFHLATQKMFFLYRELGLGYSTNPLNNTIGTDKQLLGFQLHIPQRFGIDAFAEELYPSIRKHVFGAFNTLEFERINDMAQKRARAHPPTVSDRFRQAMIGLNDYGRILDIDRLNVLVQQVSSAELSEVQQYFLDTEPAFIIAGDLN